MWIHKKKKATQNAAINYAKFLLLESARIAETSEGGETMVVNAIYRMLRM